MNSTQAFKGCCDWYIVCGLVFIYSTCIYNIEPSTVVKSLLKLHVGSYLGWITWLASLSPTRAHKKIMYTGIYLEPVEPVHIFAVC